MIVQLKYFKESGKYYCDGEYNSILSYPYEVFIEVREFAKVGILPGLISGKWDGYILVNPECETGYPALIDCSKIKENHG